ncbi:MAG: hypothetical protein V3T72_17055 [Thermoanaerobaculia bacterium]
MADQKTLLDVLAESGVSLPSSDELGDDAVTSKLWETIHALAALKIYLLSTDHLGDRQLYEKLLNDVLLEEYEPVPDWGTGSFIDVLDLEEPEDLLAYIKHYADDMAREGWTPDDLPGDLDDLPEHEDLPYDRDSRMPSGPLPRGSRRSAE